MKYFLNHIRIIINQSSILVGGQAVMEGVMMRVPGAYATAVRDPNGNIQTNRHNFISLSDKYPIFKKPLLRGIVGLFESLKIGFASLQWSAKIVAPEEENKTNKFIDFIMTILSFTLALGLFFIAPIGLTTWLFEKDQDAFIFNLISGIFRITFFLIYLSLISLMKDINRLFQYHGAEHKTVYNFESGQQLSIDNAKQFPTQHPRCGTSFIFILMLVAIISFAILDTIFIYYLGELKIWMRLAIHIPFIPIVASIGYEVLKLTAKYNNIIIFRILAKPGLWLQNITTKQPNDEQLEVAIKSLKEAFGPNFSKYSGQKYTAEAI
jgi:uncharacterized protein YqhQ